MNMMLFKLWNFWPPFLFSGIKITKISKDFRYVSVKLKKRFWNVNYVGTQYGGSIFSMADPFYMVMLMKNLGPGYTVWDKTSRIRFVRPGRTDLAAEFVLLEEDLNFILQAVHESGKLDWPIKIRIKDERGELVAQIDKVINIKKK